MPTTVRARSVRLRAPGATDASAPPARRSARRRRTFWSKGTCQNTSCPSTSSIVAARTPSRVARSFVMMRTRSSGYDVERSASSARSESRTLANSVVTTHSTSDAAWRAASVRSFRMPTVSMTTMSWLLESSSIILRKSSGLTLRQAIVCDGAASTLSPLECCIRYLGSVSRVTFDRSRARSTTLRSGCMSSMPQTSPKPLSPSTSTTDCPVSCTQRRRQVHRHRRLADASLGAEDGDDAPLRAPGRRLPAQPHLPPLLRLQHGDYRLARSSSALAGIVRKSRAPASMARRARSMSRDDGVDDDRRLRQGVQQRLHGLHRPHAPARACPAARRPASAPPPSIPPRCRSRPHRRRRSSTALTAFFRS